VRHECASVNTDEKIERFWFWSGIVAIVGVVAAWAVLRPTVPVFAYSSVAFVLTLFLSIPVTIFVLIFVRLGVGNAGGRIFWVEKPTIRQPVPESVTPALLAVMKTRLTDEGFTVSEFPPGPGGAGLVFRKPAAAKVVHFLDHAFDGSVTEERAAGVAQHVVTLRFNDTLLLESGERARLTQLAEYFSGARDKLEVTTTPFTLVCGYVMGLAGLLVFASAAAVHSSYAGKMYSAAMASFVLIAVGAWPLLRRRVGLRGARLAGLGLALCAIPFVLFIAGGLPVEPALEPVINLPTRAP
jgi:hypothetical protein